MFSDILFIPSKNGTKKRLGIISVTDDNKCVGAILMDLSKAFDCLPHQLIIAKLKAYGVSDEGAAMLWSYLTSRKQRVKLSGTVGDWLYLLKGVPQGSILGPIIFNLFMNDIYYIITKCKLYNYADDNTIAASGDTRQNIMEDLSIDTKATLRWFEDNMMEANPGKFQGIMMKDSKDRTSFDIEGTIIPSEAQVKLLGVHLDDHLNFRHHTNSICKKAGAQLKVLQRLAHFHDQPSRMQIFRCYILAHFNYCALVWHFCGVVQTAKMERLQYRALKYVFRDFESSYEELLERAKLPTLELSRKRAVLVEVLRLCIDYLHHLCGTYLPSSPHHMN